MPSLQTARTPPVPTPLSRAAQARPDAAPPRTGAPASERISLQEAVARVKAWHAQHDPVMSGALPEGESRGEGREPH